MLTQPHSSTSQVDPNKCKKWRFVPKDIRPFHGQKNDKRKIGFPNDNDTHTPNRILDSRSNDNDNAVGSWRAVVCAKV